MEKKERKDGKIPSGKAIELAILNGIAAYDREQQLKAERAAGEASHSIGEAPVQEGQTPVQEGQASPKDRPQKKRTQPRSARNALRSPQAMKEAGYQPRRPSRTKGTGTPFPDSAEGKERTELSESMAEQKGKRKRKKRASRQSDGESATLAQTPARQEETPVKPRKRADSALPLAAEQEAEGRAQEGQKKGKSRKKKLPLKVLFIGGVGEIGKNMTALEYGDDMIVIDAGITFPTEEMPGIDLVFPDITYLVQNKDKIRGIFLTHGHEDHIGGVPYLLKELNPETPVYGTKLTLSLVDNKLREHRLNNVIEKTLSPKEDVQAGVFNVHCVNVNHSIAGALAFAIDTPCGVVYHSGDFKIDLTPVAGEPIDLSEIAEIGKKGVLLYLGESTNIERPGYTMSETVVGTTLEHLFAEHADRRLIVATFASNVHRLQQIVDIAVKYRRKVALSGRSMFNVVEAASKIGELTIPEGVLIDVEKAKNLFDREVVIVSTGSQGEPMSALTRMASGDFNKVTIGTNDTIIISASPIPGNERMIYRVINNLYKKGAKVVYESLEKIHVSGHACQEEHKILHTLLKPKFFIPVHGEYRHLKRHVLLAQEMGMKPSCTLIPEIGMCVELTESTIRQGDSFPSGARLIDGEGFEDYGTSEVMKDRLLMSAEGVIFLSVCTSDGIVIGEPVVESRGVVFADGKNYEKELKGVAERAIDTLSRGAKEGEIKATLVRAMKNYLYKKTKQSPLIMPIIVEV